jgi:hypothetical protein
MTLAEQIVACARRYQGTIEQPPGSNSNSGPEIDQWLAFVHQPPGASYCAAFACSMVHDARFALGIESITFKKSASALHLLELNAALITTDPHPGDLVIFDQGHGLGHVAIVTGQGTSIAGNTSPDGKSRNGTGVFEHAYDVNDPKIAGCIRVA